MLPHPQQHNTHVMPTEYHWVWKVKCDNLGLFCATLGLHTFCRIKKNQDVKLQVGMLVLHAVVYKPKISIEAFRG